MSELTPNDHLLTALRDSPESQLDQSMRVKIGALIGKSTDEVRSGLHEVLDFSAHGSLASDFVMRVLDIEWRRLGGKLDDPAPWRESLRITHS